MFIRKLDNGKFVFRDSFKNPVTNKYQEVSCTFGKNNREVRKQAQLLLDEKIRKKIQKLYAGEVDITFAELTKKYLDMAKKQLSYATWYRKECTLNKIVDSWGKDILARKITAQFINRYLDSLIYEKDYANETVASYKSCIDVCYKLGIRYGYLRENPVSSVQVAYKSEAKKKKEEIENKYLNPEEVDKILKDCEERGRQDLKDFFAWLYLTGMRCSEAAALQRKNIIKGSDGEYYARVEGSLVTRRNVKDKKKRHFKSNSAKTYAGNRDVLLSPAAVEIAKRHCKGKKQTAYILRNEWPTSDGWFIPSKINSVLNSIAKRQNIHKTLGSHIFRHTHVSILADMGVPLYVIQHRVGHGNSRITREIYLHVTKKAKRNLSEKLTQLDKNNFKAKVN